MRLAIALSVFLSACGPLPPTGDAGTTQDAAVKDTSTTCVGDYASCNSTSVCCSPTFTCNAGTQVCQAACLSIGSICSGGDCCSGICNGTCQ